MQMAPREIESILCSAERVEPVDGQRVQRCAAEADDRQSDDARQQARRKAHHQRAEAHRDEADGHAWRRRKLE